MAFASHDQPTTMIQGTAVPTADQLRRVALARAQSRGKWVAARRLLGRQIWHVLWTMVFPVLGLLTSVALVITPVLIYFGVGLNPLAGAKQSSTLSIAGPGQHAEGQHFNTLQLDRQLSSPRSNPPVPAEPQNQ